MEENPAAKPPFEVLKLPKKELPKLSSRHYKVYEDKEKFVIVEADNVQQALQASGFKKAYRIEHYNMYRKNVIAFEAAKEPPAEPNVIPTEIPVSQAEEPKTE